MAEERRAAGPRHTLALDQREKLSVTGVLDVISFDEEMVVAETEKGVIIIKGENLHVSKLNLDEGGLEIDGGISGISYEDDGAPAKGRGSLFGKIFR